MIADNQLFIFLVVIKILFCRHIVVVFMKWDCSSDWYFCWKLLNNLRTMKHFVDALKNYANFKGRTGRKAFWTFILINFGISMVLGLIGNAINFVFLSSVYNLAVLVPSLAIGARRMHDIGKSGWFYLIPFYNLYLAIQKGEPNENTWGSPVEE